MSRNPIGYGNLELKAGSLRAEVFLVPLEANGFFAKQLITSWQNLDSIYSRIRLQTAGLLPLVEMLIDTFSSTTIEVAAKVHSGTKSTTLTRSIPFFLCASLKIRVFVCVEFVAAHTRKNPVVSPSWNWRLNQDIWPCWIKSYKCLVCYTFFGGCG